MTKAQRQQQQVLTINYYRVWTTDNRSIVIGATSTILALQYAKALNPSLRFTGTEKL